MNINYSTSFKGEYTLYDENMNVLCETDNLITDWGMRRFVGDRTIGAPHPADTDASQQAFVNNMRFIMLGTDATPASATDFRLISAIPTTEYTETNEGATTGTLLSTDPTDGDLLIIFTRMTRFQMAATFNTSLAPLSTYTIRETGCSWSQTIGDNNRYGIFSRAVLPSSITVNPSNIIFAKYKLTIKTNANQILGNMQRFNGTGATALPNNKTNVRSLPLYALQANGTPSSSLNNGETGREEYVQPLFEDMMQHSSTYTGSGQGSGGYNGNYRTGVCQSNTFGTSTGVMSAKKLWWLQMYTSDWTGVSDNANNIYNTFTTTTTSNINNSTSISINRDSVNSGASVYDEVQIQNLNLFASQPTWTGRKNADVLTVERVTSEQNKWKIDLKFLFTPNQVKNNSTVYKLYPATLGDWSKTCFNCSSISCNNGVSSGRAYVDITGTTNYGVVTVLSGGYTPNPSNFEGVHYTFAFTRS